MIMVFIRQVQISINVVAENMRLYVDFLLCGVILVGTSIIINLQRNSLKLDGRVGPLRQTSHVHQTVLLLLCKKQELMMMSAETLSLASD